MSDRTFVRANRESRERLAGLVAGLTPTQLAMDLGEGWTVASVLGHVGFWDRWQGDRWELMLAGSWRADDESVLAAEDLANDALHAYWALQSGGDLGRLAVEAATRVDSLVEGAPDDRIDRMLAGPNAFVVERFRHRGEHLEQIERAIAAATPIATTSPAAPGRTGDADRSHLERNRASLIELRELIDTLAPGDLEKTVDDGTWNVGQVLAHLAFWDRFLAERWRAALSTGAAQPITLPGELAEMLNAALAPAWHLEASRPRPLFDEILAAAVEANSVVERLPEATPLAAIMAERPSLLDRSIHRREHTAQIRRGIRD